MNGASQYGREWKLSFTLATLARWLVVTVLAGTAWVLLT